MTTTILEGFRGLVPVMMALITLTSVARSDLECQIEGRSSDNFDFGEFRLWLPSAEPPLGLVVLTFGANQCALTKTDDLGWQNLSKSLQCGLLTCFFSTSHADARWDRASAGSGRALMQSINLFALSAKQLPLAKLPLFLVGNSQGGQFSFHFAAWNPSQVAGFVSIKGGFHEFSSVPSASKVPGLFIVGDHDLHFRIENIDQIFTLGRIQGAPWCLAVEPNSGHEPSSCTPLVMAFVRELQCTNSEIPRPQAQKPTVEKKLSPVDPATSWFPSASFKNQWHSFETTGMNEGASKLNFESRMPPVLATFSPETIELGSIPWNKKSSLVSLQITPKMPVWDEAEVLSRDYLDDVTYNKDPSGKASFLFRFDPARLPLGQFFADIAIRFTMRGRRVLGGLNVPVSASITADIACSPPSIYIGAVDSETTVKDQIRLWSKTGCPIQLLRTEHPANVKISVSLSSTSALLLLNISISILNGDKNNSGVLLLHLHTDRDWTLRIPYIGQTIGST